MPGTHDLQSILFAKQTFHMPPGLGAGGSTGVCCSGSVSVPWTPVPTIIAHRGEVHVHVGVIRQAGQKIVESSI